MLNTGQQDSKAKHGPKVHKKRVRRRGYRVQEDMAAKKAKEGRV